MRIPFFRRLTAFLIDCFSAGLLTLFFGLNIGHFFASRAVVLLKIGESASVWKGPIPMLMGIVGVLTYSIPFAMVLSFLPEAIFGYSGGKAFFGLKIKGESRQLWLRFVLKTWFWLGVLLALLVGYWPILLISVAGGVIVFGGLLLGLGRQRLTLHDRLTGTRVVSMKHLEAGSVAVWK